MNKDENQGNGEKCVHVYWGATCTCVCIHTQCNHTEPAGELLVVEISTDDIELFSKPKINGKMSIFAINFSLMLNIFWNKDKWTLKFCKILAKSTSELRPKGAFPKIFIRRARLSTKSSTDLIMLAGYWTLRTNEKNWFLITCITETK